jgi:hypothetical protein
MMGFDAVKDIIILAGLNGAGKTMAARVLLPQELGIREFVNWTRLHADCRLSTPRVRPWPPVGSLSTRIPMRGRKLIAERTPDAPLVVHDATRWAMIERARR